MNAYQDPGERSSEPLGAGPHIVVTTTALLNGGDAALLSAQLAQLGRALPGTSPIVYEQFAEAASRYHPSYRPRPSLVWPSDVSGLSARLRWALRVARIVLAALSLRVGLRRVAALFAPTPNDLIDLDAYATADVITTNAGTMLVPQYRYEPRLVDYSIAHLLGRPVVHYTQTMGPFPPRWTNRWLRFLLSRAQLIMLRGETSRRHLAQLGVPGDRVIVCADPAFALTDEPALEHGRSRSIPSSGAKIGISVRDWPFSETQKDFEAAIADLCTRLVREHDAEITFISTCQGIPEYRYDDAHLAAKIHRTLDPEVRGRVTVDEQFHGTADLRARLAPLDVVVSTRLHLAILALVSGVPAIPINYEPKSREVYDRLGAEELTIDIDQVLGRLYDHVLRSFTEIDRTRSELFDAVRSEQASAIESADLFAAALDQARNHNR